MGLEDSVALGLEGDICWGVLGYIGTVGNYYSFVHNFGSEALRLSEESTLIVQMASLPSTAAAVEETSYEGLFTVEGARDGMTTLLSVPAAFQIGESLRGKTIRGIRGPRASEREICLWEGLWEGGFWEVFRGF